MQDVEFLQGYDHVHPNIGNYTQTNTINATHPQCLYPVCASGSNPAARDYGNINSAGCPFPGTSSNTMFSSTSSPSANAWNGSTSVVSISHIQDNSNDGSISFSTASDSIVAPDTPDSLKKMDIVYQESFETSLTDRFVITKTSGTQQWQIYKKGYPVQISTTIPDPTDGNAILLMYAPKGTGVCKSELTSPYIDLKDGSDYTLNFDICIYSPTLSSIPNFTLYIEDNNGKHSIYTCGSCDS